MCLFYNLIKKYFEGGHTVKKKVHYSELEDMQKYIEGFNPDDYAICGEESDPSVVAFAREYYDDHLPVDVTAWVRVNKPDENLIYGSGLGNQVIFVRDTLCQMLMPSYDTWRNNLPMVISTHFSKSVKLPVYQINLEKYGMELVLRYNFYNWKLSVKSDKPLDFNHMNLFDPTKIIPDYNCEGFPKDKVYGSYEQSHCRFTVEFDSQFELYTYVFLLKNYLGIKSEE